MDAELIKRLCGDAFELGAERLVDFLFDAAGSLPGSGDLRSAPALELPIIGGIRFFAGQEPIELRQRVFNALCAAEQFRKTAPHWAPPLPLREEAIEDLVNRDNVRLNLVGLFGRSLDYALWSPGIRPSRCSSAD